MQNLDHEIQSFHLHHRSLSGPSLPKSERIPLGLRREPHLSEPPLLDPHDIDQLLADPQWLDELIDGDQ